MPSLTRSLFLTILADHLNGRATALPDDYDEAELLKYARQQQFEGMVYCLFFCLVVEKLVKVK